MLESSPWHWIQGRADWLTNPATSQAQNQVYILVHTNSHLVCDLEHGGGCPEDPGRQRITQGSNRMCRKSPSEDWISVACAAETRGFKPDQWTLQWVSACKDVWIKGFTAWLCYGTSSVVNFSRSPPFSSLFLLNFILFYQGVGWDREA